MGKEIYASAVREAKQELETLRARHNELLRKIETLESFIEMGVLLTRETAAPARPQEENTAENPSGPEMPWVSEG